MMSSNRLAGTGTSRRTFIVGSACSAALLALGRLARPVSSFAAAKAAQPAEPAPLLATAELLAAKPDELLAYLEDAGFTYDEASKRFQADSLAILGYEGSGLLTVLGRQGEDAGRRMSPERIESGEDIGAIQYSVLFTAGSHPDDLAGENVRELFDNLYEQEGIEPNDVMGEELAPSAEGVPPVSCAVAECAVQSQDALLAVTVSETAGITLSCSYLDYYLDSCSWYEEQLEEDPSAELLRAAILAHSPWDIPIDDKPVSRPAKETEGADERR